MSSLQVGDKVEVHSPNEGHGDTWANGKQGIITHSDPNVEEDNYYVDHTIKFEDGSVGTIMDKNLHKIGTTMQEVLCDKCKSTNSKPGSSLCEFCSVPPNKEAAAKEHIKGAPAKVNSIYEAIMREDSGSYTKEQAAKMAWAQYKKMKNRGKEDAKVGNQEQENKMSSVESKWVIALGEKQLPGGVGAVDTPMPIMEDHNPGVDIRDNAQNSVEQESALKHWVDMAVDKLNRGENPEVIVSELAHDGCPDPQSVMDRAMNQPPEGPVTDEAGDDAFGAMQTQQADQEGTNQMPVGVQAKVRLANGQEGTEVGKYTDIYGRDIIKVALDSGHVIDALPEHVENFEVDVPTSVNRIDQFIESLPKPTTPRQEIANHKKTLGFINNIIASTISRNDDLAEVVVVERIAAQVTADIENLENGIVDSVWDSNKQYLEELPKFSVNVVEQASMGGNDLSGSLDLQFDDMIHEAENKDFDQIINEQSAIMVSEFPDAMVEDVEAVKYHSSNFINAETAILAPESREAVRSAFMSNVEKHREARVATMAPIPSMANQWGAIHTEKLTGAVEAAKRAYDEAVARGATEAEKDSLMRQYMDLQTKMNEHATTQQPVQDGPAESLFL